MIDVQYGYEEKGRAVLEDINLELSQGKYIALIGPNGCGKTTLLRHLNGLLIPRQGEVWIHGMNTRDPDTLQEVRRRVGMVFQNPDHQIVGMSVEEDVSFGPGNLCMSPGEIQRRVKRSLGLVGMETQARRAAHCLSSGEKQLVAIAGVLAMDPAYIALDEPTAYLDPAGTKRVLEVIKTLNRNGITIVHATHDMDQIVEADQVLVMGEGRILYNGSPKEVFTRIEWLKELGLDIPKVTELMWRLREMGNDVGPDILTLDEACIALSSRLKAGQGRV